MIEFLNDDKKTLYDFNQKVMKKSLEMKSPPSGNDEVVIEFVDDHDLDEGIMVTITDTDSSLDNRSFTINNVPDSKKIKISAPKPEKKSNNTNVKKGFVTAYGDDYDIHSMSILHSKFVEENDGYSPKHISSLLK